ncbi:hypothetical protein ABZ858_18555 [Streptomyces sp. NPDC047017]|uniref:hypothetical protein n=1 Tax=Streptomyces sp. NPDC047017 TaxID=3155024 RepID=UPI00340D7628
MKSLKAAAVLAGSLVAVGAAAPAFAHDADLTPTSLNGAVNALTKDPIDVVSPIKHQSDALDTQKKGSLLHTVNGATKSLNETPLLGGLPLQR